MCVKELAIVLSVEKGQWQAIERTHTHTCAHASQDSATATTTTTRETSDHIR